MADIKEGGSCSLKGDETVRPEMVKAAWHFMMAPKVRQTSCEEQRRFLLGKGLTATEIDLAFRKSSNICSSYNDQTIMDRNVVSSDSFMNSLEFPAISSFFQLTKYAVILAGASFASWKLISSYIYPRLFSISKPLEERILIVEKKVNELQNIVRHATAELLLKLQIIIDQQDVIDQISNQSDSGLAQLEAVQKGVQSIITTLTTREHLLAVRPLARKRSARGSGKLEAKSHFENDNL
ncbi:unnamed protein product [Thelazia callipaeda]|uniref:Peroxisomal membrane protein PEX14 n=1 Tax=Thelazia callipaeda TaxID=103827 RepID=A0A0N5D0B1_THECL|nr:unnamed protein product [Thelazia callipaeda]